MCHYFKDWWRLWFDSWY